VDFAKWEQQDASQTTIQGVPLSRYWLIPMSQRPKVYSPHPTMTSEMIRQGTQQAWDRFYTLPAIWRRSTCVRSLRARIAFVLISKLYRQMYASTGIATDSARVAKSARRARWLAMVTRRLFMAKPMPELADPTASHKLPLRTFALHFVS